MNTWRHAPSSRAPAIVAPRIALDFTQLDQISPFAGQYRYAIDLVRGLHGLAPDAEFLLLGSRQEPVPALAQVFRRPTHWTYRQLQPARGLAANYRDHVRYATVLGRERVQLLHALHTFVPLPALCPVVATIYDLMFELFDEYAQAVRSRPYRVFRWAARHRARRLIAISQTTAEDLKQRWHIDGARVDVVPLATTFTTERAAARTSRGGTVLVSPYNLEPRKNLDALLQAAAMLKERHPALRLVLYGRAAVTREREAAFEQRLSTLGLQSVVERAGELTDDALKGLMREADVFVFPSLYEGFGLPVLEAMACGACVVARSASAMAEVVHDAGALVETRDPAELADVLTALIADPERRRRLGEAARQRARTFTVERMAAGTFRSYQAALGLVSAA